MTTEHSPTRMSTTRKLVHAAVVLGMLAFLSGCIVVPEYGPPRPHYWWYWR